MARQKNSKQKNATLAVSSSEREVSFKSSTRFPNIRAYEVVSTKHAKEGHLSTPLPSLRLQDIRTPLRSTLPKEVAEAADLPLR